jgi:hypothetical protein
LRSFLISNPKGMKRKSKHRGGCSTPGEQTITMREAVTIAERKKTLATMLANVADVGAARMEETIGKASLRDAAIGTGIAVDKMLALTGQMPAVQVAVVLPTEAERAERKAMHARLDEITRRLRDVP